MWLSTHFIIALWVHRLVTAEEKRGLFLKLSTYNVSYPFMHSISTYGYSLGESDSLVPAQVGLRIGLQSCPGDRLGSVVNDVDWTTQLLRDTYASQGVRFPRKWCVCRDLLDVQPGKERADNCFKPRNNVFEASLKILESFCGHMSVE